MRWEALRSNTAPASPAAKSAVLAAAAKTRKGPWSEVEGREFLEANGVPLVPAGLVHGADEAATAARSFGFPVVLKICAAEIPHKSDIGGVALNLRNEEEVRTAYAEVNPPWCLEDRVEGLDVLIVADRDGH